MPELMIATFVLAAIFGLPIISGLFARSMGRPFLKWFAIGCILPFISIVILFFLPDLSSPK